MWILTICSLLISLPVRAQVPLTLTERFDWALQSSTSPKRFVRVALTSALSTSRNAPEEFGPGWTGYGKRAATRLASGTTSVFLETGIGALWNEDPRYTPLASGRVRERLGYALKMSVMARKADGGVSPAYARFIAIPAAGAISNAWRPQSDRGAGDFAVRTSLGFLGRALSNVASEFWPDVRRKMRP